MHHSSPIPPGLEQAAVIFCDELSGHLEFLEKLLKEADSSEDPEKLITDSRASLRRRFHVIKGGAGFLKLDRIRELAVHGEQVFAESELDVEHALRLESLRRLAAQLSSELENLAQLLQ